MKIRRQYLKKIIAIFVFVPLIFWVGLGFLNFKTIKVYAADDLNDYTKKIDNLEDKKEDVQKQLEDSQQNLKKNQSQIILTKNLLNKTESEISQKEQRIIDINNHIEDSKEQLRQHMRQMYFYDEDFGLDFLLSGQDMAKLSNDFERYSSIEEEILDLMEDIRQSKDDLSTEKQQLDQKAKEHQNLLSVQKQQQIEINSDIQDAKATLAQLNSKINNLKDEYSELLGKSVSTDDIVEAASIAAKGAGINKSFLLGVLVQESNKGKSVGGCDYKASKMSSYRLEIFKDICKGLGYDYKKQKVSCPPKSYKGTGGAMGVAQFMSDTWRAYESRITKATGHSRPDPWNLVDGVTAMAIKLGNGGASSKSRFNEAKSYCVYLAGGNWGYYCYGSDKYKKDYEDVNCWGASIKNYGEKVLCLKDNYEKYYK